MRRHSARLLATALSAALVAAACGGGSDDAEPVEVEDDPIEEAVDDETTDTDSGNGDVDAPDDEAEVADDPPPSTAAPLEDDDQLTSEGEGGNATDVAPTPGGEITWGLGGDGTGFDTTGAISPGSIRVVNALADPLVGLDPDANWYPNLAEALTPNDDFTRWTITLRPGVVFHDGEPVDGAAVAANLQAHKDSPTTGFNFGPVSTITAVDDLTVDVVMSSSWAAFPYQLVSQAGWMVSPSTIGQNETMVSTGPFMLESWTPTDSARVVRNPNYWRADEGLPYLDAINFKFLTDQVVRTQAFEAGDVDGFISPNDTDIVEWLDDDTVDVWIGTAGANEALIMLNTTTPPFDDVRVRRALAHSLDRQFLIDTFRSGLTEVADGPFNPSSKWFADSEYPDYDPAAAQALVDEYEAEIGPIEFELKVQSDSSIIEVMEVATSFFADVGIDATISEIGSGQTVPLAIADNFQAMSWFQFGAPDPDRDYVFFHSTGGFLNWSNLISAEVDAGLDRARQTDDFDDRYEGYAQFQQALATEVPMIWIDHLNGVEAAVTRPELNGIGTPGVFVDGAPSIPMTDGNFFPWTSVWLEQ